MMKVFFSEDVADDWAIDFVDLVDEDPDDVDGTDVIVSEDEFFVSVWILWPSTPCVTATYSANAQ